MVILPYAIYELQQIFKTNNKIVGNKLFLVSSGVHFFQLCGLTRMIARTNTYETSSYLICSI